MSDNSFERSVGEKLRALAGVFAYHPPDDPKTRQWKPCDFLVCWNGRFIGVEAKEVAGASFPLSRWSAQQRNFAAQINDAGGRYWLVVRFTPSSVVIAYQIGGHELLYYLTGSLKPEQGHTLNVGRNFVVEPLLTR